MVKVLWEYIFLFSHRVGEGEGPMGIYFFMKSSSMRVGEFADTVKINF